MKKYILEFIRRGLMAAWGGPAVLAIIYGILDATGTVAVLTPGEVAMGILSITLMAFIIAGISMIYTVEELPLSVAILIHAGVLYLNYLLVYLLNSWIPRNGLAIGVFTAVFAAGYGLVWGIIYLCIRRKTEKLNRRMKQI